MASDISDCERGNPLPPHGILLPISSKGYFICTIQDTTYHGICYNSRRALAVNRHAYDVCRFKVPNPHKVVNATGQLEKLAR